MSLGKTINRRDNMQAKLIKTARDYAMEVTECA